MVLYLRFTEFLQTTLKSTEMSITCSLQQSMNVSTNEELTNIIKLDLGTID